MTRRLIIATLTALSLLLPGLVNPAAPSAEDAAPEPLPLPAGNRDRIVRRGMFVLGGWALTNIAVGTPLALSASDPTVAGFWEMNALWNTVNLGLAAATLLTAPAPAAAADSPGDPDGYGTRRVTGDAPSPSSLSAAPRPLPAWGVEHYRDASHRLEKILLFNAGIDLAYMAVGGWMWDRGSRGLSGPSGVDAERLTGWGQALVLQGGFLFAFDVVMATLVARDRRPRSTDSR